MHHVRSEAESITVRISQKSCLSLISSPKLKSTKPEIQMCFLTKCRFPLFDFHFRNRYHFTISFRNG